MVNSKRGNREGSIYKRADGRWAAQVALVGDSRAHRRRKTVYGSTRAEVARKLVAAQQTVQSGAPLPSDRMTVRELSRDFLANKRSTVKYKTYENYEGLLRTHVLPHIGHVTVSKLEPSHLVKLYRDLETGGLSARSVGNVHRVLHNMVGRAVRWNYAARNVVELIDPPRFKQREMVSLTSEQAKQFLATATDHRLEALFVLALTTGARLGELLGMAWRDVDLKAGTVRIRETLQRSEGGHSLGEPKTSSSARTVTLSSLGIAAIDRHHTHQTEEQLKAGAEWSDTGLVFTNTAGTALNPNNVYRRDFKPLTRLAGLPENLRFHDLRHAFASLALSSGIPVTVVSQMLGHANPGTTMRVYAHAIPGAQGEVARAMDSMLG